MTTLENATWPEIERRKPGWARDWQASVERDKASLARVLHDDTGGLLVAAVMDITWAEKQLKDCPDAQGRLARARVALDEAIELNRRIIEELRPTLLENFGLVPALRWHFSEVCKQASIECEADLDHGLIFVQSAAIAIYRMTETLLSVLVRHSPGAIRVTLTPQSSRLVLRLLGKDMATLITIEESETVAALDSVRGRVAALGGEFRNGLAGADFAFECSLPVEGVLDPAPIN